VCVAIVTLTRLIWRQRHTRREPGPQNHGSPVQEDGRATELDAASGSEANGRPVAMATRSANCTTEVLIMASIESVRRSTSRSRYVLGVIVVSLFLAAPTFGPPPSCEPATSQHLE
jgi:hypothetical protein